MLTSSCYVTISFELQGAKFKSFKATFKPSKQIMKLTPRKWCSLDIITNGGYWMIMHQPSGNNDKMMHSV